MIRGAESKIALIDSFRTTIAMGWPVLTAARAAEAGESLSACRNVTENACANSGVLFVVETLEFLRRGGRIGGAQTLLGIALNLKPILEMREEQIGSVERIRTKQKAMRRVVEIAAERIRVRTPIWLAVTQANSESDAATMLEMARAQLEPVETLTSPLSPVIGTHAGPGTVALNFRSGIG